MDTDIELVKLLMITCILAILTILAILILIKKIKQKENIAIQDGEKTTAEVIGFRRYRRYRGVDYIMVLKFNDKEGQTHIVERVDGADGYLRYNTGDILEISYVEREKYDIPNDRIVSENKNFKVMNDYFENFYRRFYFIKYELNLKIRD